MTMTTETVTPRPRIWYGWPSIAIAVAFGLLYAYVLWNAVGNLVNLPKELGELTPWWLLIVDVAVPVLSFAVAFVLGRRSSVAARTLFFFIGLTVVACSTVASIAYVQTH
jgi:hypothetical protein